jgi:methyl-accepting chemotaxis protein
MRFSVKMSLIAAIGFMLVIASGQSLYSLMKLDQVYGDVERAQTRWVPSVDLLQQISFDLIQLRVRHARHILAKTPDDMGRIEAQMGDVLSEMEKSRAAFLKTPNAPEIAAFYQEASSRLTTYMTLHAKLVSLSRAGDKDAALALLNGEQKAVSDGVLDPIRKALEGVRKASARDFVEAQSDYGHSRIGAMAGLLVMMVTGAGVMAFAVYGISHPIAHVADAMEKVAGGDLTADIPHAATGNEIGNMARRLMVFRDKLRENEQLRLEALQDEQMLNASKDTQFEMLRFGSNMIAAINEITVDMSYLEQNTEQVTSGSGTIASASAELVSSVEEIFRSSEAAANEAQTVNRTVQVGRMAVGKVTVSMTNIAEAVDETSGSVDQLNLASEQIGQILTVIESIAAQTNLLALNATIEAARAGEAGRGFAVVANEVKHLAGQTARATEDIAHRIESLRLGMSSIVRTMARSKEAVGAGRVSIDEAGSTMETIAAQVGLVSGKMSEIAIILRQQQDASLEISRAISSVAETASHNEDLLGQMAKKLAGSNDQFTAQAKGWHQEGDPRSLCEVAKIDHVLFKKRIVDTVMSRDQWHSHDVPDHHNCRLGKWYDAITDRRVRSLPAFAGLVQPHEQVHKLGHDILAAVEKGDRARAIVLLADLSEASNLVIGALSELSNAIAASKASVGQSARAA